MGIVVRHGELHCAERDLALTSGLVAADDMTHVVGHEHCGHVDVLARQLESVAPIELDVFVPERPRPVGRAALGAGSRVPDLAPRGSRSIAPEATARPDPG